MIARAAGMIALCLLAPVCEAAPLELSESSRNNLQGWWGSPGENDPSCPGFGDATGQDPAYGSDVIVDFEGDNPTVTITDRIERIARRRKIVRAYDENGAVIVKMTDGSGERYAVAAPDRLVATSEADPRFDVRYRKCGSLSDWNEIRASFKAVNSF